MAVEAAQKKTRSTTKHNSANSRSSEVEDMLGTTARITGCVLGLSSAAVAAPLMMAAPVLGALGIGRNDQRAAEGGRTAAD